MVEEKVLTAADPCPNCGGAFVVDASQSEARLVEHHKRVAASPAAHALYADKVREKIALEGVLFTCDGCAYQARFKPAEPGKGERKGK